MSIIKHFFLFVLFCICFGQSVNAQNACDRINLQSWQNTLNNLSISINSGTPIAKKRELLCKFKSTNSQVRLSLAIMTNERFAKFPNLFSRTINGYITKGETISKLKPDLPKRTYQSLDYSEGNVALHLSDHLCKVMWTTNGQHFYTLIIEDKSSKLLLTKATIKELISAVK